ncbi:DUF3987 domain-containing protein [Streptomyces alfalfae]|uniref:DUF3987 domain-containing protein n=1 Tax=Streptomyces alfalfae TaxID=1642299 RepID=UPI001BA6D40A|nr:DUF3987 domain-containing protein [Streptomyces alfalfae]QUI30700.1 DUF3987 domain-containing protein [Streptomyces alfalfae]
MFEKMAYGPIGEAVENAMPQSEADPIGVYAAALALFSSAISRQVVMDNGRPVVVWTALVGRSALGRKGYALNTTRAILKRSIGGYLGDRVVSGISSGPSLVNHLWNQELETMGSEDGVDGRVMIVEEEWATVLKRSKRCPTFSPQLRTAWDGKPIVNTTKKGKQEVARPLLGFHAHITPGEWSRYVSSSEALGGTFNRILPVLVERSKRLPYDHVTKVADSKALTDAYQWAKEKPRRMTFAPQAGRRWDQLRDEIEERMAELPEDISCYMERAAEQVVRVAAVLTAAEKKTKISRKAIDAAWAFVEYSMASVEKLVREAADGRTKKLKPIQEVIREAITAHGGKMKSGDLLRKVQSRTDTEGLKAIAADMEDVKVTVLRTGRSGRPTVEYSLVDESAEVVEKAEEPQPAAVTRPSLRVVEPRNRKPQTRKKTAAPARKTKPQAQAKTPEPKPQPEPETVAPSNPLADLLTL